MKTLAGRYRLIEPLGSGGMSVVWRAHDEVLGRPVAVKLLTARHPGFRGRLRAEAKAAALLTHPNVTQVYDYGETGDEPFVVMELLDGASLSARLTDGPLPWRAAVEVCASVAAALAAAHSRGLVHRDVTPANIMLTPTGVKVVDFGIAAMAGTPEQGPLVGTPAYLAPEVIDGATPEPAADVYALGVVLFETMTGELPWPARSRAELLQAHRFAEPSPLPALDGLPLEVAALCQQSLAKEPAARPPSARLARRLGELSGSVPGGGALSAAGGRAGSPKATTAPRATMLLPPQERRARQVRLRTALIGAAVAVLAGAGVAAAALGSDEPSRPGAPRVGASPTAVRIACTVAYQIRGVWDTGATVSLAITNTGDEPIRDWVLEFELTGGAQVHSGWNGTWRQSGDRVTVRPASHNAELGAGGTVAAIGTNLEGRSSKNERVPERFTLNGVRCATP